MKTTETSAHYQIPGRQESIRIDCQGADLTIFRNGEQLTHCQFETAEDQCTIHWPDTILPLDEQLFLIILTACEFVFGHSAGLLRVAVESGEETILSALEGFGFALSKGQASIERSQFFQIPNLWNRKGSYKPSLEKWTESKGVKHPLRPVEKPGVFYSRYVPAIGKHISFEMLDLDRHLDVFHEWQNQKRVAQFWELDKPKEELRAYLEAVYEDPHHFPAIAAVDGVAAGYFEIYWVAEDRLGPYFDYQPFDRAFHFLIGNKSTLGRSYFNSFVESITHFLFLEDARTRTLLAEPRADNIALLHYLSKFPYWEKRYEFDFPHKRAALLASRREDFFEKATFR
ncbi:MAG: N-acetyltransferase [Proteobacteria bacterium]|nr:MAG: N-acetyltransferase [Pseudomonadota bacterium]